HHGAAVGEPRRRKHPIARTADVRPEGGTAAGKYQRFFAWYESGIKFHTAEFVSRSREVRPAQARRQLGRSRRQPRVERFRQAVLPRLALELPGAEPNESRESRNREQNRQRQRFARARRRRFDGCRHGESPPVNRTSSALWWYCKATNRPFIGRSGAIV